MKFHNDTEEARSEQDKSLFVFYVFLFAVKTAE